MLNEIRSWTRRRAALALPAALLANTAARAATSDQSDAQDDRPFSEHKLALQLSDADPVKHKLVISVAYNMISLYGPDNITIDIVVFADGMGLLSIDSPNRAQVDSLAAQGVMLSACGNTMDKIKRTTGKPFPLNPKAVRVNAGVAKLLALGEKSFAIIRP